MLKLDKITMGAGPMLIAGMILAGSAEQSPAAEFSTVAVLSGVATVKDGDGVLFGKVEVRLQGIAAPEDNGENREPGGPEATAHLREIVDGRFLVCHLDGTTAGNKYRPAGICYLGADDIGALQVEAGVARDCPAYSGGRYAEAEEQAHAAGHNLSAIYPLPSYCTD